MYKKIIAVLGGILFAATPALAISVFNSNQVGTSPSNGYYLKTDGTNSTWAAVSASGSGTVGTSTNETAGYLPYWTTTSGTPALLGKVATTTVGAGTGISLSAGAGYLVGGSNLTITNTAPDQTVAFTNGTGISVTGTYPNFTVTNTGSTFTYPFPAAATSTLIDFSGGIKIGTLAGMIAGNSGNLYGVSTTSMNASITGNAGTVTNGVYTTGSGTVFEPPITAGTINDYWRGDKTWQATSTLNLTKSQIRDFGTYQAPISATYPIILTGAALSFPATSTLYGTGLGGQTLTWSNTTAAPSWVATTTFTGTAPISLTYAAGQVTGACTTASSGVAGCLSNTAFDTFNGKENVLTFNYPLTRSTNAISSSFSTTTATGMTVSSLIALNASGIMYSAATSTMSIGGNAGTVTNGVYTTGAGTVYQQPITLTTTGSSGASTLIGTTLNIPNYATGGSFPFSADTNFGQTVYSTSTPTLWFKSGLFASSTSYINEARIYTLKAANADTGFTTELVAAGSGNYTLQLPETSDVLATLSDIPATLTFNYPLIRNTNTISFPATSTLYGTGTGGYQLAWNNTTATPYWVATSTLADITGTLTVLKGGTGVTSFTANSLLYSNSAGTALAYVATSSLTTSGFPANMPTTFGKLVGGSGTWTWWGLATTTQPAVSSLLTSNGVAGVYGTATTSLTGTSITVGGSGYVVGGAGLTVNLNLGNANTWTGQQTFNTVAPIIGALGTGLLKGNGASELTIASNGTDYSLITAADCTGTGHLLSVTAAGVFTCSADSGGGGIVLTEETPSGNINSSNKAYTVSNNPQEVLLNGIYQIASGEDYTLTGTGPYTITFVNAPTTGSNLRTLYSAVGSVSLVGTTEQFPYFSSTNTLSATSSIVLDTTGFIGIGSTTPSSLLSIQGTKPWLSFSTSTVASALYGYVGINTDMNTLDLGTLTNHGIIFETNNTDRLIITNAGAVGIGTTTPSAILSVVPYSGSTVPLFMVASSTAAGSMMPVFMIDKDGHLITSGRVPVVSACGGGSPSVVGNDQAGKITTGSAPARSCTLTFVNTYNTAPVCIVSGAPPGGTLIGNALVSSTTATKLSFMTGTTTSNLGSMTAWVVNYICVGTQVGR